MPDTVSILPVLRPRRVRRVFPLLAPLVLLIGTHSAAGQPVRTVCTDCHSTETGQFRESVHAAVLICQDCHGGPKEYSIDPARVAEYSAAASTQETSRKSGSFDHGAEFLGKADRASIPVLCGECHADVARMNPYGLRTDQLASYWVSGHGQRLRSTGDARVAVCVDCHGIHEILRKDHPKSRVYFQNIPATCEKCHADRALMTEFQLPSDIPAQYAESVHGQRVLRSSDPGAPNCATCHGSHAAAPPGVAEVGHVCGKCHQQIEREFTKGIHGRLPLFPRCVGCHAPGGNTHNHGIREAGPTPSELIEAFREVRSTVENTGDDLAAARAEFAKQVSTLPNILPFDRVCLNCHSGNRTGPHSRFFEKNDLAAQAAGIELAQALELARFEYARAAERVERLGREVLLVEDEAVQVEQIRTELLALNAALHSLDAPDVHDRVRKVKEICGEVHGSLDAKETSLTRRSQMVAVVWVFVILFAVTMYRKYLELRAQYVTSDAHGKGVVPLPQFAASLGPAATLGRRRFMDHALRGMGLLGVVALIWPTVAYIFPVRRRGGAAERVNAGKVEGWAIWEIKKVSVAGKAVGVIRTDGEFRAFSLICTHLGCIVQWNQAKREFECPCHAAQFDAEGRVTGGPPPKPLERYSVAAVQGEVMVSAPG